MKIVVAGASGFVGRKLIERLSQQHQVIALSRSRKKSISNIEWRQCDLFSLLDVEKALEGADLAVYLVHSMLPSARLVQGNFEDFDFVLADNFARAAKKNKLKKIIYLGGIIPDEEKLSPHLESRLEVENLLESSGIATIALRAGLIIGPGGSSFRIMQNLVRRLPVMLCPKWTQTVSTPVYLDDVVGAIELVVDYPNKSAIYDLGNNEKIPYQEMMKRLAVKLKLKRAFFPVPFFSPGLSKLWVCLVTGAPRNLVYPLIASLKSKMVPKEFRRLSDIQYTSFDEMLEQTIDKEEKKTIPQAFKPTVNLEKKEVRSIQRLLTPDRNQATAVAAFYFKWLPRFLFPIIKVKTVGNRTTFHFIGLTKPLLILEYSGERSLDDRQLFYIKGGLLAYSHGRGRLEFRDSIDGYVTIAAIHEYQPRLPWYIYNYSQALIHLFVMNAFRKAILSSRIPLK